LQTISTRFLHWLLFVMQQQRNCWQVCPAHLFLCAFVCVGHLLAQALQRPLLLSQVRTQL
jgi:hypothetical protein